MVNVLLFTYIQVKPNRANRIFIAVLVSVIAIGLFLSLKFFTKGNQSGKKQPEGAKFSDDEIIFKHVEYK